MVASTSPTEGGKTTRGRSMEKQKMKASPGGKKSGDSGRRPDTTDPLLISIASRESTLVQQFITLTCYIPSAAVGAVIGRRGATIAQIQRQAQQVGTSNGPVRLSIVGHQNEINPAADGNSDEMQPVNLSVTAAQSLTQKQQSQPQQPATLVHPSAAASVPYTYSELDWSSPLWTPVVIRADPCATLCAAQLLRDKVGQIDDVVMDVPLGRAKHASIVGRRGYVLSNLSADTNVRIMVPRRDDVIQLEGELGNVKRCLERVLVISSDSTGSNKKKGGSNGASSKAIAEKNTDEFTSVVVTLSVLPSQTKMRTVGRKTDTLIKKKKVDENTWDLIVSGASHESIQSAVSMLKKWGEENSGFNTNDTAAETGTPTNSTNASGTGDVKAARNTTPSRPKGRGRQTGRSNRRRGKAKNKAMESPSA